MGIKGLTKLLGDHAPACFREQKFENYFGRKIAIDASMHIYQFLVVVGRVGEEMLTSETGEVTSHLQGMFFRTARMLEAGIKPVYVFDGKPPALKRDELDRRLEKRSDATEALEDAREVASAADIEKYSKRTVKVTPQHNAECRRLLKLLGVPVIEAPSEAEAQCAAMCKAGQVYAMASEDMDSLTFGTPRLLRHLMEPSSRKIPVTEFEYDKVLQELQLTAGQFIDLCILCGCDYCGTIRGIGPTRALQLLQKHGSLTEVLAALDPAKYPLPEPYPYTEAAQLFQEPEVAVGEDVTARLKWNPPDIEGIVQFLVGEKSFNEDRVRKAVTRITAARDKSTQGRLESFFGPVTTKSSTEGKRKEPATKGIKQPGKKGKVGSGVTNKKARTK